MFPNFFFDQVDLNPALYINIYIPKEDIPHLEMALTSRRQLRLPYNDQRLPWKKIQFDTLTFFQTSKFSTFLMMRNFLISVIAYSERCKSFILLRN